MQKHKICVHANVRCIKALLPAMARPPNVGQAHISFAVLAAALPCNRSRSLATVAMLNGQTHPWVMF